MRHRMDQMRRRAARYVGRRPLAAMPDRPTLSLGFDDFPVSAWTEAGPILAQHGVKATYFVCGGLENSVNLDLPQFRTEHLQALHAAGHEVGCHTFEHVSVLRLSPSALSASLERNARWVAERLGGHAMTTFAYPFGDVGVRAKTVVADRFGLARGVRDGVNGLGADRANLKAIGLESRRLPGYDLDAILERTSRHGGWLHVYGHDVSDRPTPYGCRPVDLDDLLTRARRAGLDIQPLGTVSARNGTASQA